MPKDTGASRGKECFLNAVLHGLRGSHSIKNFNSKDQTDGMLKICQWLKIFYFWEKNMKVLHILFAALVVSAALVSCNRSSSASISATPAPQANDPQGDGKHFGETITADGAVSYSALLQSLERRDSMDAKVTGTVAAVCQAKGCWIRITPESSNQPEMVVKFKDYAFFLPKDIAGRKVVLQGIAYREVTSVEELRHYAEDDGKSAEEIAKITQPKEELKFMAAGVLLLD